MEVEAVEMEYQNVNFTFSILRISTTLHHTYQLLYFTGHIQMTSVYSTIESGSRRNRVSNVDLTFSILRICTTLYHTCELL